MTPVEQAQFLAWAERLEKVRYSVVREIAVEMRAAAAQDAREAEARDQSRGLD